MHWTESITHDGFRATPKMPFRSTRVGRPVIRQALCAIGQVLPVVRLAHKIQSGISRSEGQSR